MTDEQRLEEIRSRAEAATPGPWRTNVPGGESDIRYVLTAGGDSRIIARMFRPLAADAEFVANCREDVEFLLNLLDRRASDDGKAT